MSDEINNEIKLPTGDKLVLSSSPHIKDSDSVRRIMYKVILALLPACIAGVYFFGWRAALVMLLTMAFCVGAEALWCFLAKKPVTGTISDGSAALTGLLLALLVTQIVAFPSALIFGRLSNEYPSSKLIPVCIAAYAGIAVFAFFLTRQWQFWVLAVIVGMFQGGVQALSRSHFAKIIPPEKSGEYFGLFDICGKGASFLGTMIVSVGSQLTGSANVGVGSLIVLFVVGFVLFRVSFRQGETA